MQTFKQFFYSKHIQNEGFLRNALGAAALGAAALSAPTIAGCSPSAPEMVKTINGEVFDGVGFAKLWAKYYNAEPNDKTNWGIKEIQSRLSLPNKECQKAIRKAAAVFENDSGIDFNTMCELLKYTGRLESDYNPNKLQSSTGAVGYFQVVPSTARDRIKNGRAYFGRKFQKAYESKVAQLSKGKWKGKAVDYFLSIPYEDFRKILKNDPEICAAFAAAKWVTIGQIINNKQTKILNKLFDMNK